MKQRLRSPRSWHLAAITICVVIVYLRVFHAGFMAWDDGEYVLHNKDIRGFDHISEWFSHFYVGNYQPLTMASYALDHLIGGQQPFIYHLTSILLHIGTAWLLYLFVNRLQPYKWVAFFVALLFALHPSQTESVSWVAERKTVLSGFFCLLALWQYTGYVAQSSSRKLMLVTVAGIAAMLSKGIAVSLPLALLATDMWLGRDLKAKRVWLEKLPLLACSIIIGIVAIQAQQSARFLNLHSELSFFDSIIYAGYAYTQYLVHLFVPIDLSVIYPYPKELCVIHYLYTAISIAIICLGVIAYRKRWFILAGGIAFYTVNIIFVLQFVQFGEVLMADRYMYIACIGVWVPAVYYLYVWLQQKGKQALAISVTTAVALAFAITTFIRNDIWLTDFEFFNAIVTTFPDSAVAQYSVGNMYMKMGDYAEAGRRFDAAVQIEPGNYKAWHSKGALALRQGKAMEALDALNKSLEIKENTKAYFSRAMLFEGTGRPQQAISDIDNVLAAQPENARAWYIKGDCLEQTNDLASALEHYNKAIALEGTEPLFYIRRGLVLTKLKRDQPALEDLEKAVSLNPNSGEALYYRAIVKHRNHQSPCADLHAALAHGYTNAQAALDKFCVGQ
jgi:tetratricopeptide (TPR) repeat protein